MGKKHIKVIFDISQLEPNSGIKAGIFKVTQNILDSLIHEKNNLIIDLSNENTNYNYTNEYYLNTGIEILFSKQKIIVIITEIINKLSFQIKRLRSLSLIIPFKALRLLLRKIVMILKFIYTNRITQNKYNDFDYIYFSTFFNCPIYLKRIVKRKYIVIHDVIPLTFPQYFDENFVKFFKKIIKSISKDHYVFCVSKATKYDLLKVNKSINPNKIWLLPLAAAEYFKVNNDSIINENVRLKYGIDPMKDYILSVCTFEPRKNIDSLIRAYVKGKKEKKLDNVQLVLIGVSGWKYNNILKEIEKAKEIFSDDIIITGYVKEEDLSAIYTNALMFVYPSYYEGFGLPVLEAMQCGTPVITSNISSLPEVAGDAALYIDPYNENSIYEAVITLSHSEQQRKLLSAKGINRASGFSWEKTTDIILKTFQSTL